MAPIVVETQALTNALWAGRALTIVPATMTGSPMRWILGIYAPPPQLLQLYLAYMTQVIAPFRRPPNAHTAHKAHYHLHYNLITLDKYASNGPPTKLCFI